MKPHPVWPNKQMKHVPAVYFPFPKTTADNNTAALDIETVVFLTTLNALF